MVFTIVSGEVVPEKVDALKSMWSEVTGGPFPPGLQRSFLLNAGTDWRIVTMWRSREELDSMRASGETPGAIRVFAAGKSEPTLAIFEVVGDLDVQ